MSCGSSYGAIGAPGAGRMRAAIVAGRIELREQLGGVHAERPVLVGERLLERRRGRRGRRTRPAPPGWPRARRWPRRPGRARSASRSASAPPAGFSSPTIRAAVGAHGEVRLLQLRHRERSRVGRLETRKAPTAPPAPPAGPRRCSIDRTRSSATSAGSVASTSASAARTVHCESGSMPDSTSTKLLGVDRGRGPQRGARIAGHGSVRKSWTIGQPSAARSVPSAVTASRRTFGSRRARSRA